MSILSYVKDEIQVIRERDPAIKSNMEVFLYPSFLSLQKNGTFPRKNCTAHSLSAT